MDDVSAPSLRPRTVVQLYDAAFEAAATSPGLVGAALVGAAPLVAAGLALWYAAAEHTLAAGDLRLLAFGATLATLWRMIGAGAAAHVVQEGLAGRTTDTAAALGAALRRAPSLMAAGVLVLWVATLSVALLLVPMLAWGGAGLAAALVMERACAPWSVLAESRRRLGGRATAAVGMTLLWVLGILLLAFNLALAVQLVLWLAQSFGDLDVGLVGRLLSPGNPVYVPALLGFAFLLLEPVRHASLALLLADARVRQEGLDLAAAVDALPAPKARRRGGGVRAAGLALLVSAVAGAAGAQGTSELSGADRVRQAAAWAAAEGAPVDPEELAALLQAGALHDAALARLADALEADLHAGRIERAGRRLDLAAGELRSLSDHEEDAVDARALAGDVLSRPEFRRLRSEPPTPAAAAEEAPPGWFERLLRRFLEWLREREHTEKTTADPSVVLAPIRTLVWGVVLVVLAALVIAFVVRSLGAETTARAPTPTGDTGEAGAQDAVPALDPLSRPPDAWLGEADRLAREGAFREAVRAAYLALLALLHRGRAIDYAPTRTNWDHVRGYRGAAAGRQVFADLTRRFERAWYGVRAVTADEFRVVRDGAADLGALDPAPAARGQESADA